MIVCEGELSNMKVYHIVSESYGPQYLQILSQDVDGEYFLVLRVLKDGTPVLGCGPFRLRKHEIKELIENK